MRLMLPLLLGCGGSTEQRPASTTSGPVVVHEVVFETDRTDADVLADLFSGDEIEAFELSMTAVSYIDLRNRPDEWVPADFTWRGLTFEDVGVRIKGQGSFLPIDQKPSLKIEFDKYVPGQDFFGLDVLVLNNMISDWSKVRERLAYSLYRDAGVPAARAAHGTLRINGSNYGLYTHMEDVDERMLALWFDDPDGPLFELFDAVLSPEEVGFLEHESGPYDLTVFQAAAEDLALPRDEAIVLVEDHVDMDAFLTYYAVSAVVGQFDAWPLNDPTDDVHLYVDPLTRQIHPIPHGLDESFQQPTRNIAIPGASLLGQACYFTTDCHERLEQKIWEVYDLSVAIDFDSRALQYMAQTEARATTDPRDGVSPDDVLGARDFVVDYIRGRGTQIEENLGPR